MHQHEGGWTVLDIPEMDALPCDVYMRSQNLLPHQAFPPHFHRWNQFVYATSGTIVVTLAHSRHIITSEQAIWVPTGTIHTTGSVWGAEFRNLYIADQARCAARIGCAVYQVTPLLRQLIIEFERVDNDRSERDYRSRIAGLLQDQISRLEKIDFHLPWPHSEALRKLCEALYADPAHERSLDEWGEALGAAGRTLARRFEKETGLAFREWRRHLRLFRAIEWLASGKSITSVALDLGYNSTSAFTYMFREAMGKSPSEWQRRSAGSQR
ncbi:AraC family transcriptional regulator [Achromobacter denitrificans]